MNVDYERNSEPTPIIKSGNRVSPPKMGTILKIILVGGIIFAIGLGIHNLARNRNCEDGCQCGKKDNQIIQQDDVSPTQPAVTEPVVEDNTQDGNNVIIKPQPGPNTDVQQPNEPIVTEPIVTEPIVTEPVTTEPPTTEPPVTEPPVTDPFAGVGVKPQDSPDLGLNP